MPVTVTHALSMTTPDNPAYENQPQHWNSAHAVTLNVAATEISGLFSNANRVSFGLSDNSITASINARASTDALGLNTAGSNVTWTANSSGLSIDARGYAGTATAVTGGAAVTLNSGGLSFNGASLAGTTSGFTGANISASITHNTAGLAISASVAAPGAATLTVSAVGNTTVNSSGTWPGALSLRAYGILSAGTSNGSLLLSTPDPVDFTYFSAGASTGGNTAGDTGMFSQRLVLAGGNNITLSGSSNGGSATLSIVGGAGGGGVAISAGTQSVSTGTVVYSNSNNITFGMSGSSRITASAALNLYAVGNTTQSSSTVRPIDNVSFNGLGALSVGFSNGTVQLSAPATSSLVAGANITVSTDGSTISIIGGAGGAGFSAGVSTAGNTAGDTGMTATRLVLVGSNNVTLSQTTGANGATVTVLGANTHAQQTGISGVIASDATYTSGTISFSNQNGVTIGSSVNGASQYVRLSVATSYAASNHSHGDPTLALTNLSGTTASASNGFTLSLSAAAPGAANFSVGVSNGGNTAGDTGVTGTRIVFAGGNNVTMSQATDANGATLSVVGANTHAQQTGISGVIVSDATYTSGTISFSNQNGVTIGSSVNGASQYVRLSVATSYRASNDALGTATAQTNVTWTANSAGLSINAEGYAGTATALTGAIAATVNSGGVSISVPATSSLVGTNGLSVSTNGSTISVLPQWRSFYENDPTGPNQTMTFDGASVSHAVRFILPEPISGSYIRIPVLMTTNQTTIATTAATRSVSGAIYSTWNAVLYSLGSGASSRSLQSVASGSNGWTFMNSLSIAVNGTQYSVTQGFSANAEGAGTTRTTQYSISNTNYSLTTNQIATEWSSGRYIDIPFAASLSGGDYWLVLGYSTSSATNSAGNWTNANVRYSNHYGVSATNMAFGVMGSTNLTSTPLGAGSFSTAGGGTTASIPLSAISSSASHVRPYFQIIRQA